MKHRIQIASAFAFLIPLVASASAQNIVHDGLTNSPLGVATLSENATGHLVVSNIGSSGLDGVRINLPHAQGTRLEPTINLGTSGSCRIKCDVFQSGAQIPFSAGLSVTGDGTGNAALYTPDFGSIGNGTYTLRVFNAGALIYDQGGLNGPTKMHNGGGQTGLPLQVYMTVMPFGPWNGAFLECSDWGGGSITPPGSGPLTGDFFEFISEPNQFVEIGSMEIACADTGPFEIGLEEMSCLDAWVTGLDDAHLDSLPTGKLKVSNLGSSGCDGVSIAPGGDTDYIEIEMVALSLAGENGGIIKLQSVADSGELDEVTVTAFQNQCMYTPDFSALGSQTFTLELHLAGQLVFVQNGMSGPSVTNAGFSCFSKRNTVSGGQTTTEWCIQDDSASPHTVSGGPTILADKLVVRSEPFNILDDEMVDVRVCGGNLSYDLFIESIGESGPCVGNSYCQATANSVGPGALMCSSGSSSIASNDLDLVTTGVPPGNIGLYFYGPNQVQVPFGNGWRCVGGGVYRLPPQAANGGGVLTHALDNTSPLTPAGQISAGELWNFQLWYRDPAAGGSLYNTSNGHSILFTP
ncbi:MAG: hypothetical protein ACI8X5_003238 [Planctomycetota bacterium]|jgi:hypothetical protein